MKNCEIGNNPRNIYRSICKQIPNSGCHLEHQTLNDENTLSIAKSEGIEAALRTSRTHIESVPQKVGCPLRTSILKRVLARHRILQNLA